MKHGDNFGLIKYSIYNQVRNCFNEVSGIFNDGTFFSYSLTLFLLYVTLTELSFGITENMPTFPELNIRNIM